jgi:hypothetical protein
MEVTEYLKYKDELIIESSDENHFVTEGGFISNIIPALLESKLIDSEDFTDTFYQTEIKGSELKINGYIINDSGERLQLFIMYSDSIDPDFRGFEVSVKDVYDKVFKKASNFINRAIKGYLNDIEDIGAINALISHLSSSQGAEQFDAIEIFLVSATATVSTLSGASQPKRMEFKDEYLKVRFTKSLETFEKDILVVKRLIDLNFLHNVLLSQGNGEALHIDFLEQFDYKIEAIKAADEKHFESYLCVLPASILSQLYLKYSSRLLEKNVRSFLQFRGVNRGMRATLTNEPEKFIAYNNGLTITAGEKKLVTENDKYYITALSDFQIVNGGQTTASIYFSKKDGIDISNVKVMAKINVAKDVSEDDLNELISNISKYSNSQSKVSSVDLRSRNQQLTKVKALSESVITPSGRKWFFEKSKGEFNTKLRIAGSGKKRIEKEYPRDVRFTKELLGKYYCSWGNEPYLVKKGGEAIFRKFLEEISNEDPKKRIAIDRNFYEFLISKILLFRKLEILHGTRSKAIGQLRSAVVPYTIALLYNHTEGNKKNTNTFNLGKLWIDEGLSDELSAYLKELMVLVNGQIKKLAKSDDVGEYSKKKELWEDMKQSSEIIKFLASPNSELIFKKYSISKKELKKRMTPKRKSSEVDFKLLTDNVNIHANTATFYNGIENLLWKTFTEIEKKRIALITNKIKTKKDLDESLIEFESNLMTRIRTEFPETFDKLNASRNDEIEKSYNFILGEYNKCILNAIDIELSFDRLSALATSKGVRFGNIFVDIGKILKKGDAPTIDQLYKATNYIKTLKLS